MITKYMITKLIGGVSLATLLLAGNILPVLAQTTTAPSKTQVAACMKAATAKKKAASKEAKKVYKTAKKQAKGKAGKAMRAKALEINKQAQKTVKETFAADRQACVTGAPRTEEVKLVTVDLLAQNDSGESGKATLKQEEGKVKVTLDLTGAPAGVTQPAHLHMGSCASLGAVIMPLTFSVDGKSETTFDFTLAQLKLKLPVAVNVHKSVEEAAVYVACGDIKF